jgi:hypothetical protein
MNRTGTGREPESLDANGVPIIARSRVTRLPLYPVRPPVATGAEGAGSPTFHSPGVNDRLRNSTAP